MHLETNMIAGNDPVVAALILGLEAEFGGIAGAALAARFLDAEAVDFHWDARLRERWLGGFGEEGELDRIAILGRLQGRWFAAILIVDGDGQPHGMLARRSFARRPAAERAFANAR